MKKLIVIALVMTLLLSLAACSSKDKSDNGDSTNGSNNDGSTSDGDSAAGSSGIALDVEEETFYFDWETIEMFGGIDEFIEWLMYDLELDAEDIYESLYGEYYNSPVEKVSKERGWLDGYRTGEGVR